MSKFHDRTLALLGNESLAPDRSAEKLIEWAKKNAITLPEAFLEWARIDGGKLLRKYSNDDWFGFDEPELKMSPDGVRGLEFNCENQGNFTRIVALDQSDDPPVFLAWLCEPPWVVNAERFSDAVFAQVFDWQYWLEFKDDDPAFSEIAYYGSINLKSDRCLALLRQRFEESVTTRWMMDGALFVENRFPVSPLLRLTVTVADDKSTEIRITGPRIEMVKAFEVELRLLLLT